jgi:hypothetical protein
MALPPRAGRKTTKSQKVEDSGFRQLRRLTNLLLRIKRYECQMLALEKTAALHDVPEMKGVSV